MSLEVQSRGTRHFSDEVVLEELGALRFGMTNETLVRESSGEASRKAGCLNWARPV
jgi:hypothetical protein